MDAVWGFPVGFCRQKPLLLVVSGVEVRLTPVVSCVCLIVNFLLYAGTRFALFYRNVVKKDWLPGVAGSQPRLGFRFWGVSYKERGGLHQPPFSFSEWLVRDSRGWSVLSRQGAKHRARVSSQLPNPNSTAKAFENCKTLLRYWCRWASNHARVRTMTSRWCLGLAKRWPSCS